MDIKGDRLIERKECLKALERMSRKKFEKVCIDLLENMGFSLSDVKSFSGDILAEGSIEKEERAEDYVIKCTRSGDEISGELESLEDKLSLKNKGLLLTTRSLDSKKEGNQRIELAGGDKFYRLLDKFGLLSDIKRESMEKEKRVEGELIEKGDRYLSKGDYKKALESYEEAISEGNNPALAFFKKGKIFFEKNSLEEAVEAFQDSLDLDPENPDAWNFLAKSYYERGKKERALEIYDKALDYDEDHLEAWRGKGRTLFELEMYEEAVLCFERILEVEPKDAKAWNNKGLCHLRKEEYKEALESINNALSIQPDFEQALLNKALVFEKLEKLEQALTVSEKLIDSSPKKAEYHYIKGAYLEQLERPKEAWDSIQRTLQLDPNHERAQELQFILQEKLGKTDDQAVVENGRPSITSEDIEEEIGLEKKEEDDKIRLKPKGEGKFELEIEDNEKQLKELRKKKEELESALEDRKKEIAELSEELEKTKKEKQKKEKRIEEEIEKKGEKVKELSGKQSEFKSELEEKKRRIEELKKKKDELKDKVQEMEGKEIEKEEIETTIEEKEQEIKELAGERESLKSKVLEKKEEIDQLKVEKKDLQEKLRSLEKEVEEKEELEKKVEKKDKMIKFLKYKLKGRDEKLKKMREDKKELENKVYRLQRESEETGEEEIAEFEYEGRGKDRRKINEALMLWKMDEESDALDQAPKVDNRKALNLMGCAFYADGDLSSAEDMFLDARPSVLADMNLEEIYFDSEEYEKAVESIEVSKKREFLENLVQVWERKGETLRKDEKYDSAIDCYKKAQDLEAEHLIDFIIAKVRCEVESEDLEKGIDILESLDHKEKHPAILNMLGVFYYLSRRYEDSIGSLEKAADYDLFVHHNNFGCSRFQLERYDEALDSFETALSLKSDDLVVLNNIGFCQLEKNMLEAAVETFKRAIEIDEKDPVGWFNKGIVLKRLEREGWKDPIEKAVGLDPDFEAAERMLES